ncbi:acyltransferase [Bradyrhizobium sp. BR 10289]|uniref:acyltransferase family protein n=1 Tax=Bradyrhizobium sp. BR 10289 TaxID=2749993 RepID=UPI001C651AE6|nr:acyltransferase [Bradyrhizobium sp. BR 10289]MBW7971567.1 acyltransferase [Bradyrhizobium sp. BR 10289]
MTANRFQSIDGLRGIAALSVIVQHCLEFTPLKDPSATFASSPISYIFVNDLNLGRFGVIVFFFISGFLIPSSIGNHTGAITSFVIGRFFRLYPLYWLSIVLALVAAAAVGNKMPTVIQVVANLSMFQMLFGIENILYPYWTLLIEHFFYILCVLFFIVGALHDRNKMRLIMFASGAFIAFLAIVLMIRPDLPHAKQVADLMYTASFLFAMIVGHNIRLAQTGEGFSLPGEIPATCVAVFLLICIARQFLGDYSALLTPASVFISTIGALALFLVALQMRLFSSSPFVYLGQISYGLYLFHGIALWIAIKFTGKPTDVVHALLLLSFVVGLTFVVSALTFRFVETPCIAIGRSVRRRVAQGRVILRDNEALASIRVGDAMRPLKEQPTSPDARG